MALFGIPLHIFLIIYLHTQDYPMTSGSQTQFYQYHARKWYTWTKKKRMLLIEDGLNIGANYGSYDWTLKRICQLRRQFQCIIKRRFKMRHSTQWANDNPVAQQSLHEILQIHRPSLESYARHEKYHKKVNSRPCRWFLWAA